MDERGIPRLREWRTEALQDNHNVYMGRTAILFKDLGLNKGRGWFLNFSEAALIFS